MWTEFGIAIRLVTGQILYLPTAMTRLAARRSVALFPLVGIFVGVILASVWSLAGHIWSGQPFAAAALVLTAGALATGARPLDGIVRMADGLAAAHAGGDRSRAFAAMRDPRRGAIGVIGLVVVAVLKLGFITALATNDGAQALIVAAVLGRWATSFSFAAFPLASAAGVDAETHNGLADAGPNEFLIATVIALACGALQPIRGLLALLVVGLCVGPASQFINRRLGGLNAPICQAMGEIGEVAALACLAAHWM